MEFDIQHPMSESRTSCAEIEKNYECNGELERALHVPLNTTPYVPPTGKDLEYRIHKAIEEAADAYKKDASKKMKVSDREVREKLKNGN